MTTIYDIASTVPSVDPSIPVREALDQIQSGPHGYVAVRDEAGLLKGIVAHADALEPCTCEANEASAEPKGKTPNLSVRGTWAGF